MSKSCPKDKIINPITRRCVKIDGKIGKSIMKPYQISVAFTPNLVPLGNPYFDEKKLSGSFEKIYKWRSLSMDNFLKWYNYFVKGIQENFNEFNIKVLGYEVYKRKYLKFTIQGQAIKEVDTKKILKMLKNTVHNVWNMSSNTSYSPSFVDSYEYKIYTMIIRALNPDPDENYLVNYKKHTYLVENQGSIQII